MDAISTRVSERCQTGYPVEDQRLKRRKHDDNCDRFIPNRSAMDFDYARCMLTERRKARVNPAARSPSSKAYQKLLSTIFNMNRKRIMAFKNKMPTLVEPIPVDMFSSLHWTEPRKPLREIPQTATMRLAVPDLIDDFCLNLMDWGSNNVLAVALHNSVYLWDASNGCVSELVTIDDESGPVTSVSWAPHGLQIAIGLENSEVQIWDFTSNQLVRSFRNGHYLRVGSLVWNNDILTTGGMDGKIINNDVRVSSHVVEINQGHHNEVCGLKWSESGRKLASGGSDGLVYIWDRSMASRSSPTQWLHRLRDHTGSVKALAWSPFQPDLLASGGGEDDGTIKFWNTHTGVCLDSSGTGSLVSGLLWNKSEKELLSSHGGMRNQLSVWKYPRMLKMADLTAHAVRILFIAQSPDGCEVASAGPDEAIRIWDVFETSESAKVVPKTYHEPFSQISRSHIR